MKNYLLLCGGVGGAKLALGFSKVLEPSNMTIVVNTGDDFEYLNFKISFTRIILKILNILPQE